MTKIGSDWVEIKRVEMLTGKAEWEWLKERLRERGIDTFDDIEVSDDRLPYIALHYYGPLDRLLYVWKEGLN